MDIIAETIKALNKPIPKAIDQHGETFNAGDIVFTNSHENLAIRCHNKKVKIEEIIKIDQKPYYKAKLVFLEDVHCGLNRLIVPLEMLSKHEPSRKIPKFANKDKGKQVEYTTRNEHGQTTKGVGVLDWIDLSCSLAFGCSSVCGVKHENDTTYCHEVNEVQIINGGNLK